VQTSMKYFSIRALFDYWSRLRGDPLVPECGEVDSILEVKSRNHAASGGPYASPNQLAPVLMFQRAAKRSFDIIVAILGLILLSPIVFVSSLAIMLDSRGPIIRRHGYGNEAFRVLKFRSARGENIDRNIQVSGTPLSLTRVGHILRSSGIDGVPQLINVLRGQMSIVGPRPYTTFPGSMFPEQTSRISRGSIKPGLTGWAQVNGYLDESSSLKVMRQRIECDAYYVENWSFLLDMKIILMTFFSKKAYVISEQDD
jgi:lipopolysaccharide/colanic/teichoic acid biosynthesis glycosyltransferase